MWLKSFHIVMVVSWFAGLFYLPRLFVNLAMEAERRRLRPPAADGAQIVSFCFAHHVADADYGHWLWLAYFPLSMNWMWVKLALVAGLVGYHLICKNLLRAVRSQTEHQVACLVPLVQ